MPALRTAVLAVALLLAPLAGAEEPPPAALVTSLHATLLEVMRDAESLGFEGRRARLEPSIRAAYDFPEICRIVLGSQWKGLSESDRARMVDAFSAMTVATYASRFDGFSGERFATGEAQAMRGGRRLVRASIVKAGGDAVQLDYVLHEAAAGWRIVNVVADGVSDLALKRAEYATIIKSEGFPALVAKLEAQAAEYARGAGK